MRARKGIGVAVLAVAGVLMVSGYGYAQGVGNVGALPSVFPGNPAVGGWIIGQYGVVRDPNGPAWIKNLTNPNGGNIIAQPGQTFTLGGYHFRISYITESSVTGLWEYVCQDLDNYYGRGAGANVPIACASLDNNPNVTWT